jgi:hypothetical protein
VNYTITRVTEESTFEDGGRAVPSIAIAFQVGKHGPFVVRIPKAQFSAAAANAKIAEFVRELVAVQGLQG